MTVHHSALLIFHRVYVKQQQPNTCRRCYGACSALNDEIICCSCADEDRRNAFTTKNALVVVMGFLFLAAAFVPWILPAAAQAYIFPAGAGTFSIVACCLGVLTSFAALAIAIVGPVTNECCVHCYLAETREDDDDDEEDAEDEEPRHRGVECFRG